MKPTEVSKDIIGKRCKCIFTGMMVALSRTQRKRIFGKRESAFRPSSPVGDDFYTEAWAWGASLASQARCTALDYCQTHKRDGGEMPLLSFMGTGK